MKEGWKKKGERKKQKQRERERNVGTKIEL